MKTGQAAILALLNVVTVAVAAAVSTAFDFWKEWWHPLLLVGAACSVVSSTYLAVIANKMEEESPERRTANVVSWVLLFVGLGLGIWLRSMS